MKKQSPESYSIFISYRRGNGFETACLIADRLKQAGYSVFFDVESLKLGKFDIQLYRVIEHCTDFILVLPEKGLDRCHDESDWVRLETLQALEHKKNIIPFMLRGFELPKPMPQGMEELEHYQAVAANDFSFFDASIEKLKSYLHSKPIRKWVNFKKLIGTAVLALIVVLMAFASGGSGSENKQDKIDKAHEKLLDTYNASDSIQLMWPDFLYINKERRNLLLNYYEDKIIDNQDGYYARLLALSNYNLCRSDSADFYTGNDYWLRVLINTDLDNHILADTFLQQYIDKTPQTDINSDAIWYAELNGNFSLARNLCERNKEITGITQYDKNIFLINYAHALLMTGEKEKALKIYKSNISRVFEDSRIWKNEVLNDFTVFKWLGFNEIKIADAEKALNIAPQKLYTSLKDTSNADLIDQFYGKWRCPEDNLFINWEITCKNHNLCFYIVTDSSDNEVLRMVSQYRLISRNDSVYIEEYNLRDHKLSAGTLLLRNKNEMDCRIIYNGYPRDTGKIRHYTRISDE